MELLGGERRCRWQLRLYDRRLWRGGKLQKVDLLRALAVEREQLVKEKAQLLEEKLHVEGHLQRFLVSMPFASPMRDMVSTKSTSGVPAWTMPAPFAPANEEEDNVTLRPPVA
jgi:hypothetical protein